MSIDAFIALNRFGFGPRFGEISRISRDPKIWLYNQLETGQRTQIGPGLLSTSDLYKKYSKKNKTKEQRKKLNSIFKDIYQKEMEARFNLALETDQPFIERLVHFWSNHFTISGKKSPILMAVAGAYEREAIRPNVLGNFTDMLLAVERHPAMLVYLDNIHSVGENSLVGKRKNKGLNENLAREILELHTLGVGGGYTQKDVISLAKIITGWSFSPHKLGGGGGFKYNHYAHEPGDHILLGKRYTKVGESQGVEALKDLARNHFTAKFISTKLIRHFITDNPDMDSVNRLTKVFTNSNGNLKLVYKEMLNLNVSWQQSQEKIKTPYETMVSSIRLTGIPKKIDFEKIIQSLALLDHLPFNALSPAGWSDKASDWMSPNALMNRVEWCNALAFLTEIDRDPSEIAKEIIGPIASNDVLTWIARAPTKKDALALLLASSEFQRR